jgi:hypothetical protein
MSVLPNAGGAKSNRTHSIVAIAAAVLIAACGTGIAAFAGLLPASDGVAVAVTAAPLVDVQIDAAVKRVEAMR